MLSPVAVFVAGLACGAFGTALASATWNPASQSRADSTVVELRLYTIDKGRLDDFAAAWQSGVYPLRLQMGYQIPFAAKIPATNQFVWLLTYDGPVSWNQKEAAYYASDRRRAMSPDPAQWIARPERWFVQPTVTASPAPR